MPAIPTALVRLALGALSPGLAAYRGTIAKGEEAKVRIGYQKSAALLLAKSGEALANNVCQGEQQPS